MKLELKNISPYLPYDLKYQWESFGKKFISKIESIGIISHLEGNPIGINGSNTLDKIKPILRPMTDLKPENGKGASIWAIEVDRKFNYNIYMSSGYSHVKIERYPYVVFEYLLQNHFDVFGLIEQGLAIDINTLES